MTKLLNVENLSVQFRTDEGLISPVRDVSFSLERGKTLGIVGESGSGKSVSTKAIMQLLPGTAQIAEHSKVDYFAKDGRTIDVTQLKSGDRDLKTLRGGEIGMIFQEPMASFSPVYSVGNQIMEAVLLHRNVSKKEARDIAIDMLDKVGITDPGRRIDQYPHEMSGGMRQRAMIALALSAGPALLIADEPTTALDVTIQAQVLELMRSLQDELNMGMIFITHDLGVIAQVADDVAVMYKGEIVEHGSVREVIRNPQQAYTKRLLDAIPRLDRITPPPRIDTASGETLLLDVKALEVNFDVKKKKLLRTETTTVRAVKGVNFKIHRGETLGLVGESGSGKTTIGRAVLRAIDPTGGAVMFVDQGKHVPLHNLSGEALRTFRPNMSLVFQDPYSSLNPRMTVRDLIAEPLIASGLMTNRDEIDKRVRDIAARCKLDLEHLRRFPHAFSGGQRQRICIARALVSHPKFVVCDECVSALDVSIQAEIIDLLKDIQEETGISFLFIAHDLAVVAQISHRVAVLYHGEVIEYAPTDKLFFAPQHPYTRALLSAVPHPDPDAVFKPITFEGEMQHPVAEMQNGQIQITTPEMGTYLENETPQLIEVDTDHFVACYRAETRAPLAQKAELDVVS